MHMLTRRDLVWVSGFSLRAPFAEALSLSPFLRLQAPPQTPTHGRYNKDLHGFVMSEFGCTMQQIHSHTLTPPQLATVGDNANSSATCYLAKGGR